MEIAQEWTKHANLKFMFVSSMDTAQIRVSFAKGGGHWCLIGKDSETIDQDKFTMNLDGDDINERTMDDRTFRRTVLHEFGHVLGCPHEHQRSSEQSGIRWNEENIYAFYRSKGWTDGDIVYNVLQVFDSATHGAKYTSYDNASIMLYSFPAQFIKEGAAVRGGEDLSEKDIHFIKAWYPATITFSIGNLTLGGGDNQRVGSTVTLDDTNVEPRSIPSLLRGLYRIRQENEQSIRIPRHKSQTTAGDRLTLTLSTFDDVLDATDQFSWSSLSFSDNAEIQYGHQVVGSEVDARSLGRIAEVHITFKDGYSENINPTVLVWVYSIRGEYSQNGLDFDVHPMDITPTGFVLSCRFAQNSDCSIFEVGVAWLAYLPLRTDIHGQVVRFPSIEKGKEWVAKDGTYVKTEEFPGRLSFDGKPGIFVALNRLDVGKGKLDVSLYPKTVTDRHVEWCFTKGGFNETQVALRATFIAVKL